MLDSQKQKDKENIESYLFDENGVRAEDIVYHYCSLQTFENIMESKTLWLKDITKSNDKSELRAIESQYDGFIKDALEKYCEEHNIKPTEEDLHIDLLKNISVYAICFCKDVKLSMYRYYADNCKGVAIGFNRKKLEEYASQNKFHFEDINYLNTIDEHKKTLKEAKINFTTHLEDGQHSKTFVEQKDKISKYDRTNLLKRDFYNFKHPWYEEEAECRLCIVDTPENKIPETDIHQDGDLNNYIKISFEQLNVDSDEIYTLIEQVFIGENCENSCNDVEQFLCEKFGPNPQIYVDQIPKDWY